MSYCAAEIQALPDPAQPTAPPTKHEPRQFQSVEIPLKGENSATPIPARPARREGVAAASSTLGIRLGRLQPPHQAEDLGELAKLA